MAPTWRACWPRRPRRLLPAPQATKPLQAHKGRASYLGERSIGHVDPGAQSTAYLLASLAASAADHPEE